MSALVKAADIGDIFVNAMRKVVENDFPELSEGEKEEKTWQLMAEAFGATFHVVNDPNKRKKRSKRKKHKKRKKNKARS